VARLHLLLKHGRVREDTLEILDIGGTGDDLTTRGKVRRAQGRSMEATYPVVPGARLKDSGVSPRRVQMDSLEGS
jgi:hypothetical protein